METRCKLLITNNQANTFMKVGCETIVAQKYVNPLSIRLDNKLDFNEHIIFVKNTIQGCTH